jgi:hypothetical protein
MFAAILIVVMLLFLTMIVYSNEIFSGLHLTGNPSTP